MIRKIPKIALLIGALAMAGCFRPRWWRWGGPAVLGALVGAAVVGSVVASQPREVYVQQPVYVQPQPVYAAPPPVYYAPPPPVYVQQQVYYRPAPVYYGPPRGYYGPPTATTVAAGNRPSSCMKQASPSREAFFCARSRIDRARVAMRTMPRVQSHIIDTNVYLPARGSLSCLRHDTRPFLSLSARYNDD
jgi:hypothetical protein